MSPEFSQSTETIQLHYLPKGKKLSAETRHLFKFFGYRKKKVKNFSEKKLISLRLLGFLHRGDGIFGSSSAAHFFRISLSAF